MKTFIISIILFAVVTVFVIINMVCINRITDSMLEITDGLPDSISGFEDNYASVAVDTEKLWNIWDKKIGTLSMTIGYDNINRADDAIAELYAAVKNRDGEQYVTAALKFSDCLERLRKLENFDFSSIF